MTLQANELIIIFQVTQIILYLNILLLMQHVYWLAILLFNVT